MNLEPLRDSLDTLVLADIPPDPWQRDIKLNGDSLVAIHRKSASRGCLKNIYKTALEAALFGVNVVIQGALLHGVDPTGDIPATFFILLGSPGVSPTSYELYPTMLLLGYGGMLSGPGNAFETIIPLFKTVTPNLGFSYVIFSLIIYRQAGQDTPGWLDGYLLHEEPGHGSALRNACGPYGEANFYQFKLHMDVFNKQPGPMLQEDLWKTLDVLHPSLPVFTQGYVLEDTVGKFKENSFTSTLMLHSVSRVLDLQVRSSNAPPPSESSEIPTSTIHKALCKLGRDTHIPESSLVARAPPKSTRAQRLEYVRSELAANPCINQAYNDLFALPPEPKTLQNALAGGEACTHEDSRPPKDDCSNPSSARRKEVTDGIIEDKDDEDDNAPSHGSSGTEIAKRWTRIIRCAVGMAQTANSLTWVEGTKKWRVKGALSAKVQMWKESERRKDIRRLGTRWMDDAMDVDEDGIVANSPDSYEDVQDLPEVKALKSLIQSAGRDASPLTSRKRPHPSRRGVPALATLPIVPEYTVLVVDTNILLSSLSMLASVIESLRWTITVPLHVIMELDGPQPTHLSSWRQQKLQCST
ncbi:hypothetical protein HWV62_26763 [Athelia sp. TMB]|nr:hypothetical protein HWV62_26763 [Athelia sp. TMB]